MQINTERLTALNVGTIETYLQTPEIKSLMFLIDITEPALVV